MELSDVLYKTQEAIRVLPSKSKDLKLLVSTAESKEAGASFYSLSVATEDKYKGIRGRIRLWDDKVFDIIYNLPIMEKVRAGYSKIKIRNDFLGTYVKIYDKKTGKPELKAKAPWFTALLSYLFGSFVKLKSYVANPEYNENSGNALAA